MDPTVLGQGLVSGLLIGGVYALVAAGLALIFGVMRVINFAQGSLLMVGMYTSYWLHQLWRIDPYLSIPAVAIALFGLGYVAERVVLDPARDAPEHNQLLLTLGLSLILQNAALTLWGASFRSVSLPYTDANLYVGFVAIGVTKIAAFFAAIVMIAGLYLLLTRTDLGRQMRAAAEDRVGALVIGIDVRRMHAVAFGIGSACAGIAGALILPFLHVSPNVGEVFVITAFIVVVLGGMGSVLGALVGGLIVGVAGSLGAALLPAQAGSLNEVILFVLFVGILLLRPTGLFGTRPA